MALSLLHLLLLLPLLLHTCTADLQEIQEFGRDLLRILHKGAEGSRDSKPDPVSGYGPSHSTSSLLLDLVLRAVNNGLTMQGSR